MNDAERGIAAYQATVKKPKKPKGRKRQAHPDEGDEVKVAMSESRGSSVPVEAEPEAGKEASKADKLLRGGTGGKGYKKVAKFLVLLGKKEAAEILKHFDKEEIDVITQEITRVRQIDKNEAEGLLSEFGAARRTNRGFRAGIETAKSILTAAFGDSRANRILKRVAPETREKPFQFLNDLDHEQILLLLKNESTPTMSIILPYLEPRKASKMLESLVPDLQRETIRRIAKMTKIDPDVILRIEGVLKERIRTQGKVVTEEIDGREALARILKHMRYSDEEKILDELASVDPELSQNVKDRLFTIDLIFNIDDAELQAILRDYDDQEIAVLLKAKEARIQDRILSSLSSRRQTMVREEVLRIGKMRKSDVDSATKDFVDYLVDLDDKRHITIHWNDEVVE